jgi:hypothetical protein
MQPNNLYRKWNPNIDRQRNTKVWPKMQHAKLWAKNETQQTLYKIHYQNKLPKIATMNSAVASQREMCSPHHQDTFQWFHFPIIHLTCNPTIQKYSVNHRLRACHNKRTSKIRFVTLINCTLGNKTESWVSEIQQYACNFGWYFAVGFRVAPVWTFFTLLFSSDLLTTAFVIKIQFRYIWIIGN